MAFATAATVPATASAAWGPDSSFSDDGIVTTNFGNPFDVARDVAVQSDGKIVAVGETDPSVFPDPPGPGDFAVARYNADGTLDSSFDGDGLATVDFGGHDRGWAVALQPDGRIVVAGQTITDHDIALARLNPDGALDPAFSGDGKVTTDLVDESWAYDVAVLPDGKILTGGSIFESTATGSNRIHFLLARYNADGSLDSTFGDPAGQAGPTGVAVTDFGRDALGQALAIVRARPVLVGYLGTTADDIAVARYTASGAPDTSFSGDGKEITDLGGSPETAYGVGVDGDEIVTAGTGGGRTALVRYRFDGSLAPGFGTGGVLTTEPPVSTEDVAIGPDGKIVIPAHGIGALRLNRDGTPDESFGTSGLVQPTHGTEVVSHAVALDPSGRIVLAGDASTSDNRKDFAVARLAPPLLAFDDDPPLVRIRIDEVQELARRIRIRPRCPREPCRVRATGILITKASPRRRFRLGRASAALAQGERRTLKLNVPRKARRAATRALSGDGSAKARLKVKARDDAGNQTVERARVKLIR